MSSLTALEVITSSSRECVSGTARSGQRSAVCCIQWRPLRSSPDRCDTRCDIRRRGVEALEEALCGYGCPEIFNTDQGRQFNSDDFTGTLQPHGSRSAWMASAATWTTSSSSGCDADSNTRGSTSTPMPASPRPGPASAPGSAFITRSASTKAWAIARRAAYEAECPDMWTIGFADRPRLRPHPHGTTTNHRIDIDEA
jgi:hypothetical protein